MTPRYFFWAVLLIFLFQNCVPPEEGLDATQKESSIKKRVILGKVNMLQPVAFKVEGVDIELDLQKGEIVDSENPDWDGFCLQEAKLGPLQELLAEFPICQTDFQYPKDQMCTLQYQYPYLSLFLEDSSIRTDLGEKNSGCPAQMLHLCEHNEDLENHIAELRFNQDFSLCP